MLPTGERSLLAAAPKRHFQDEYNVQCALSANSDESGSKPRLSKRRKSDVSSVDSHADDGLSGEHSPAESVHLPASAGANGDGDGGAEDVNSPSPVNAAAVELPPPMAAAPGRVCAHCRTVKTPLWRNGPHGPKTLCNACGVRFKLGKLQMGANGLTLVPVATKAPTPKRVRKPSPGPSTPPRASKPKWFAEPLKDYGKSSPYNHKLRHFPVPYLSQHDGALLLLQLAGCNTGVY